MRFVEEGSLPDSLHQLNHGVTAAALEAWREVAEVFDEIGVVEVGGIVDYPLHFCGQRYTEQALYVKRADGVTLYLTGCSWGYGGEGPHGTATILKDIGLYETMADALRFVCGIESMMTPWRVAL